MGPSAIADVPRGERVHQRGLDLHAQGDLLPRRAPHAAARREPDGRHAASSRARGRRDRARDGDVQRRRRHGLERRGPTSGERKGRSRDGRLRDSLRASSVWRADARPRTSVVEKRLSVDRESEQLLIHSAPRRGSSRPAQEKRRLFGFFSCEEIFSPIRSRSTADRDRERRSNARGERPTAFTEPVRARAVPAQRTASRRSEGSEGERGCACRGGRRGAVPPGCRIANGLARRARGASSDRAGRADSSGKGTGAASVNVSRGIDGDRARRSTEARFDRETRAHARVRGASRDGPPGTGPCSVASARSPRPIARFERASGVIFPERARHVGTARYFLSRREAHGRGARFDRSRARAPANDPAPPRRPSPRVPAPAGAFGGACRPRASRAPRVPAFSLTARPPLERNDRAGRPPIDPRCPDESAGEKKRRPDANRC